MKRLNQIGAYISKDSFISAERLISTLMAATQALVEFPEMGRSGRVSGSRELPVPHLPYIFIYRVKSDALEILTIIHTPQEWPEDL